MAEFLVELYVPETDPAAAGRGATSARRAAEELTREGTAVTYLRSIFVPKDETCFVLYEAPSVEAVHQAARRAELQFERVAEALTEPEGACIDG
jgi:hypothetical protein